MTSSDSQTPSFDSATSASRQALYRFAALSMLDPKAGSWEELDALRNKPILAEASAWIRELPQAKPATLGWGERPLEDLDARRVMDCLPDSRRSFNAEYERTFGLLVSNACPPYETEYIDGKLSFQRSNALADVSGFYRAFGLTISDQHSERHDHVALELEFMAFLIGLERQAADGDHELRDDRLQVCRDAQSRFLSEHLAWWLPALAKLLRKEGQGGFYEAVGVFLAALVPAERAVFGLDAKTRSRTTTSVERPEACEGCQLSS